MTILAARQTVVRPCWPPRYASWQDALRDAIRDPAELCRLLELPPEALAAAPAVDRQFRLFVPRGFAARMRPGDPHDPLLRQVLPLADETAELPGYSADPVGDASAARRPGLLQKYRGRALLVTTGICAVHCRYCFRRHYPYQATPRSLADWEPALRAIAADCSLGEVILSGGDPLSVSDGPLAELVGRLAAIRHLRRLRIHTRLPIVIPERVTDELIALIQRTRLSTIVVVHANHAHELDDHVAAGVAKMVDAGIVLLNQAVLLRGVNDTAEAQAALCERLVDLRVMPYYLHQLDRVSGAAHFEVPVTTGRRIMEELRARLPGYAVPRYVQEIPGAEAKIVLI